MKKWNKIDILVWSKDHTEAQAVLRSVVRDINYDKKMKKWKKKKSIIIYILLYKGDAIHRIYTVSSLRWSNFLLHGRCKVKPWTQRFWVSGHSVKLPHTNKSCVQVAFFFFFILLIKYPYVVNENWTTKPNIHSSCSAPTIESIS